MKKLLRLNFEWGRFVWRMVRKSVLDEKHEEPNIKGQTKENNNRRQENGKQYFQYLLYNFLVHVAFAIANFNSSCLFHFDTIWYFSCVFLSFLFSFSFTNSFFQQFSLTDQSIITKDKQTKKKTKQRYQNKHETWMKHEYLIHLNINTVHEQWQVRCIHESCFCSWALDTKGPGINNPDYALKVLFFLKEEKEICNPETY